MSKNVLAQCFIKEETFKPDSLGGKTPITVRQLKVEEGLQYQEIIRDPEKTQDDAINYAVKCAMVNPVFFSDEELENLNMQGYNLIREIHGMLPMIGMSSTEKKQYKKKIEELAKQLEESNQEEESSEEDPEKK